MQRRFGVGEFEPAEERRDRELTLGPFALTGIGLGLLVLCAIFFALGYAAGRRSEPAAAAPNAQHAPGQSAAAQAANALSKPTAASTVSSAQPAIETMQQVTPAAGSHGANPLTSYAPGSGAPSTDAGQMLVRPALPAQSNGAQQMPAAYTAPAQSAPPQAAALMVQVASLSNVEDARVLVSALHQWGYAVTARRGQTDGMIHVQVGPFATRAEANAMCQKLLGDGYNAQVLP